MTNQVFVSYAHVDERFINVLDKKLSAVFHVWVDRQITPGQDWRKTIDEAISQSFAVLLVLTPEASASKYVTYEWSYALGLDLPVIPLRLRPTTDMHPRLDLLQYFDFTDHFRWVDDDYWNELIRVLQTHQNKFMSKGASLAALNYLEKGKADHAKNNLHNALEAYSDAMKFASPSLLDDIHYGMAMIYLQMDEAELAEHSLNQALHYNDKHVEAMWQLGNLYRKQSRAMEGLERETRLEDSKVKFLRAVTVQFNLLDDEGESVWGSLGGIYQRLGQIEKAIEAYQNATQVRRSSYPYNNLGLLYLDKSDFDKMRSNFRLVELYAQKKLAIDPGDEWVHNDLTVARLALDKKELAEEALSLALVIASKDALYSLRSTLERLLNKPDGFSQDVLDFVPHAIERIEQRLAIMQS